MEKSEWVIVVDPGVSRRKAIASDKRGRARLMSISPYCAEVPRTEGERLKRMWGDTPLAESAWVSDIDGCYLLGDIAQKYQGSSIGNSDRKYEKALYQVLGTLGHFARELDIPNRARLVVAVLLPFDEYATKEQFAKDFRIAIEQFDYCGKTLGFELVELVIRPEGAGTYLQGLPKSIQGKTCKVSSFVVGYRNASWLVNDKGYPSLTESKTCDLGFRWLIDEVKTQTGHKDELWITREIFSNGDQEICELAQSLLSLYWGELHKWIRRQSPVDHIVVSGGTALLLKPQIEANLPNAVWPDALLNEIQRYESDPYLAFRFVDPFGVFKSIEQKLRARAIA